MIINYVTKNIDKIESAKQFFKDYNIEVNQIEMETPELQSDSVEEIAKYSAKFASEKLKKTVIKNDTGFFVEALDGFPGAYSHYVEDKIGDKGLLKLLDGEKNRNAYFLEAFAYCEYGKEPIVFLCKTNGKISLKAEGNFGSGWDNVFIAKNNKKPLACYPDNERHKKWNNDGFEQILNYLNKIK